MSAFSKMVETEKPEWKYRFKGLCELTGEAKDCIEKTEESKKMINADTVMNEKLMPLLIDALPYDITKCMSHIARGHDNLPTNIKGIDIYRYFTRLIFKGSVEQHGGNLWSSFFKSSKGIPERFIETLACRLDLKKTGETQEHEFYRYVILYTVITFYFDNIDYLKMYIDVVGSSLKFEPSVIHNIPLLRYINKLCEITDKYIDNHSKCYNECKHMYYCNWELNFSDLWLEIKQAIHFIAILEKIVYVIFCKNGICNQHICASLRKIDPELPDNDMFNDCSICKCTTSGHNVIKFTEYTLRMEKINKVIVESIEKNTQCYARFIF